MKSLDEVIKSLEICTKSDTHRNCKDCPYPDDERCFDALMSDALAYLREYLSVESVDYPLPCGTLHFRAMIPAEDYKAYPDLLFRRIRADIEIKMDELLRNYEQAYGLEPVTFEEAKFMLVSCNAFINYLIAEFGKEHNE